MRSLERTAALLEEAAAIVEAACLGDMIIPPELEQVADSLRAEAARLRALPEGKVVWATMLGEHIVGDIWREKAAAVRQCKNFNTPDGEPYRVVALAVVEEVDDG